ncbi:ABC transporter ATP-binding protein [Actinospongicola halichondriae]|uniref:ABC transporter ATP-binding protein n=1 Tax=Actinospongicola halichondriae TaxID=3236844 RepID=UPI003D4941E8
MTDDWAVSIEGVGKHYTLGEHENYGALRDAITNAALTVVGRRPPPAPIKSIWAIRDISAQIAPGEIVGLIGRNGAGKSTLLKILSRVTSPTEGRIQIRGQVGSLLEVGAGFHPELTGLENVFLNGSILGMSRRSIQAKLDEIIEFSELAEFMSTPVKRYSVGMYMRLAFTVAAHLDAEVLAVDEVLAVGDERFQRKCLGKINDVARAGRTVLFVSHNIDVTTRLCDRCLLIDKGSLLADGPADEVARQYLAMSGVVAELGERMDLADVERSGSGEARFRAATIVRSDNGELRLRLEIDADGPVTVPSLGVTITSESGVLLLSVDTAHLTEGDVELGGGTQTVEVTLGHLPLVAGRYRLGLRLANPATRRIGSGAFDHLDPAFIVRIDQASDPGTRPDSLLSAPFHIL